MTKYFKVTYTLTTTETQVSTTDGESVEDVANKLRNHFSGSVDNLIIHEIVELEPAPVTADGKPKLRVVN